MKRWKLPEDIGKRFHFICCLFSPGPSLNQPETEKNNNF
jgi:hypothetical protein